MEQHRYRFWPWFLDNWSRMALPAAALMLCSLPVFLTANNAPLVLAYALLPIYMVHQYEEHAHGGFVRFVNETMGEGREVLTKVSAFWINVLDVWLLFLVSYLLAKYVALGFALMPVYLTLINGITHIVAGVALRRYNPGLITSLALFLPLGLFLLAYVGAVIRHDLLFNTVGVLAGVAGHAVIIAYALSRRNRLRHVPR